MECLSRLTIERLIQADISKYLGSQEIGTTKVIPQQRSLYGLKDAECIRINLISEQLTNYGMTFMTSGPFIFPDSGRIIVCYVDSPLILAVDEK